MSNFTDSPKGSFIIVPKALGSHFDRDAQVGFCTAAAEHNVDCKYMGTRFPDARLQIDTVLDVVGDPGYYNIAKAMELQSMRSMRS